MLHDFLLVAAGLALLFLGGEGLVRGSVAIAERLGISKLLIGLVIVGFGTSTPELLVSVQAALAGTPEIALGNVIGSNIFNILAILGVTVVIQPIEVSARFREIDMPVMLGVALLLLALLLVTKTIGRLWGFPMLALYAAYMVLLFSSGVAV